MGRLVYKLIQTERHDSKFCVKYLDAPFYNYPERKRIYSVLISHNASNEMELNVLKGDTVLVIHRHPLNVNSSGMLYGYHRRNGFVPPFKLEDTPTAVDLYLKV